jgi:transcriptional regulator with XRE-family HTH domain
MTPDEVKAVRKVLGCSARELAAVLDVTPDVVLAWEKGELFPTKRHVDLLAELKERGPSAVPRRSKRHKTPMMLLSDPEIWSVVRKMLVHEELRADILRLAAKHADPADE